MELYDITKIQKIVAETKSEREISERLYTLWYNIVKTLTEEFQVTDNKFNHLLNRILDLNEPHKPNPFQSWHEVDTKSEHIDSKQLKMISDNSRIKKSRPKSVKFVRSISQYQRVTHSLKKKEESKPTWNANKIKMVNESVIKKAIEGKHTLPKP